MAQLNHVEWDDFIKNSNAEHFTEDNFYATNTNQFIIETQYPDYKEIEQKMFTTMVDEVGEYPDRTQYSIFTTQVSNKLSDWFTNKIKKHMNYYLSLLSYIVNHLYLI